MSALLDIPMKKGEDKTFSKVDCETCSIGILQCPNASTTAKIVWYYQGSNIRNCLGKIVIPYGPTDS